MMGFLIYMAKTYYEKLKDPRWQRKRLEVMQRDDFACTRCGAKDETLNVHHWFYAKSGNPWDAKTNHLDTLCEDCHVKVEGMIMACKSMIQKFKDLDFCLMDCDDDEVNEMSDFFHELFNPQSPIHKTAKYNFRVLRKSKLDYLKKSNVNG